jgi:hypothetical protein
VRLSGFLSGADRLGARAEIKGRGVKGIFSG